MRLNASGGGIAIWLVSSRRSRYARGEKRIVTRQRVEDVSDAVSAGLCPERTRQAAQPFTRGSQATTGLCASRRSRSGEMRGMCRCVVLCCTVLSCVACSALSEYTETQRRIEDPRPGILLASVWLHVQDHHQRKAGKRSMCKRREFGSSLADWRSGLETFFGANMGGIGARPEASRRYSHCALYRGRQPEPPAHPCCPPCDSQAQFRLHFVRREVPKKKRRDNAIHRAQSLAGLDRLPIRFGSLDVAQRSRLAHFASASSICCLRSATPIPVLSCHEERTRARPPVALTSLDYPAATC